MKTKQINTKFYDSYKKDLQTKLNELTNNDLESLKQNIVKTSKKNGVVYILGNGGSISTANHISVDLLKNAKINSKSLYNDNLITCFSNDYGYENWMQKYLEYNANNKDLIIFLSVSGESKNILKAAKFAKKKRINFFSLTGFKKNNSLNRISKHKIWVNSHSYNKVEILHFSLLAIIVDMIIGKTIYKSNL